MIFSIIHHSSVILLPAHWVKKILVKVINIPSHQMEFIVDWAPKYAFTGKAVEFSFLASAIPFSKRSVLMNFLRKKKF